VSCAELTKRIKASKSKDCTLQFDADRDALLVNGGCVEHVLRTLDAAEFPVVPDQAVGDVLRVRTDELKAACHIAQIAVAKEPSRYAIDGVLLESDGHAIWLVATDGRRLVEIELEPCACQFTGQVILPGRLTALITRLADPKRDPELAVYVQPQPDSEGTSQPARLFVAGCDWLVSTIAVDGMFPKYQDYIPKTGKRFIVDRQRLLATLDEVALATDFDCKAVCVELSAKQVHIAAASHANGTARGTVPADCPNASSRTIRTGFNALLLQDAVKSLTAERMVIDLQPNQRSKVTGNPIQQPALFYGEHEPRVRWLIMPVSVD
jgi:DNA polymerase-3 subunit beta